MVVCISARGGGLYYVNPQGVVTHYGQNLNPNDSFLSRDEKTLYVPSRGQIFTLDVESDGSLKQPTTASR